MAGTGRDSCRAARSACEFHMDDEAMYVRGSYASARSLVEVSNDLPVG